MHILLDPDESYSLFKNGGFYLLIKGLSSGDKAKRGPFELHYCFMFDICSELVIIFSRRN